MKVLFIVVSALIATSAWADESCEVMKKVDGRMTFVSVPCSTMKTVQIATEGDAAKKQKCGKDFMALRVGMTLDRFEECHEALSYVTETVGKGGTVETYRSTFYLINANDGRIVSYTKRRF